MRAHALVLGILCFPSMLIVPDATALGKQVPIDPARNLRQLGYATDTEQQVLAATKSENYFIRHQALEVLAERIGKQAIPTLKVFLADPHIRVRSRSAHLLYTLGDKSGLDQMRRDLKQFSPPDEVSSVSDPNDPNSTAKTEKKKHQVYLLREALIVAQVLAELGDHSGFQLAARAAFEGQMSVVRTQAILTLVGIARVDDKTLSKEGIDPVSVLCEVAVCERRRIPFGVLVNSVRELHPERAIPILERAKGNAHQSPVNRQVVEIALLKAKAKAKNQPLK